MLHFFLPVMSGLRRLLFLLQFYLRGAFSFRKATTVIFFFLTRRQFL